MSWLGVEIDLICATITKKGYDTSSLPERETQQKYQDLL